MRDFAKLTDTTPGTISLCIKGKRSPPVDALRAWAKHLPMKDDSERKKFIEAGMQEKANQHPEAAPYMKHLEKQIAELKARVRLLESAVEPANILLRPLSAPFAEAVNQWAESEPPHIIVRMLTAALSANAHLAFYLKDNQSPLIQRVARLLEAANPQPTDVREALQILDRHFGISPPVQRGTEL